MSLSQRLLTDHTHSALFPKHRLFFIIVHLAEVMRTYFENSVAVNEQALALPVFPVDRSPEIFSSFNTLYKYLMEVGLYSLLDDL